MRHGSDILTQSIVFGADTSNGTSGLPHSPSVRYKQADSCDPHQDCASSPSSGCSTRVSHSLCPGKQLSLLENTTSKKDEQSFLSFSSYSSFGRLDCFDDRSWCCGARIQPYVYASCVSIGRHQSSGFVLQGAGLQMQDREKTVTDFFLS